MTGVPEFTVSDFVAVTNQMLEYAYPTVTVVGEVSSFKVNQGKFVFFDIKDDTASVGCFMMLFSLKVQLEDGMKVAVSAVPKLTQFGKFSLTVKDVRPVGEGSIKRGFELLKAKLEKEGLFASERKRTVSAVPERVAVISSTGAAGYGDFVKIVNELWGGLVIDVAQVQVQGFAASRQVIRALEYLNEQTKIYDAILILRGGGSADDLAVFNNEELVRAITRSRTPVITGIGHEQDITLADLAADIRASTPSNAAQILVPDKNYIIENTTQRLQRLLVAISAEIDASCLDIEHKIKHAISVVAAMQLRNSHELEILERTLKQLNPNEVLKRGYSIVRAKDKSFRQITPGDILDITTATRIIKSEVTHVQDR